MTEAGTYDLNDTDYDGIHHGPGSIELGTVTQIAIDANQVDDFFAVFFAVYNLNTQVATMTGPIIEAAGASVTQSSAVGDWLFNFQWTGRNPGLLGLSNSSDQTFLFSGGQPGDSTTDVTGTWSVNNNEIAWKMSDGST